MTETFHVPPTKCPNCRTELVTAQHVDLPVKKAPPIPGDVVVCLKCSAILRFGATMHLEFLQPDVEPPEHAARFQTWLHRRWDAEARGVMRRKAQS